MPTHILEGAHKFDSVEHTEACTVVWAAYEVPVYFAFFPCGLVRTYQKKGTLELVGVVESARRNNERCDEVYQ